MADQSAETAELTPTGEPQPGSNSTTGNEDSPVYAVSYPPAMYARDILKSRTFAEALGYGWLHDENSEFARTFRLQVERQAELYEQWLESE